MYIMVTTVVKSEDAKDGAVGVKLITLVLKDKQGLIGVLLKYQLFLK